MEWKLSPLTVIMRPPLSNDTKKNNKDTINYLVEQRIQRLCDLLKDNVVAKR